MSVLLKAIIVIGIRTFKIFFSIFIRNKFEITNLVLKDNLVVVTYRFSIACARDYFITDKMLTKKWIVYNSFNSVDEHPKVCKITKFALVNSYTFVTRCRIKL